MKPARVLVRTKGVTATVRVAGRATCMLGSAFREFLLRVAGEGVRRFEIGLGDCEYMDSTFLGVLGMLAVGRREARWDAELVNVPPRVLAQLSELGLRPYFSFAERAMPAEEIMTPLEFAADPDLKQTVREAHETLSRIEPANAARFANVLDVLGRPSTTGC